MGGGGTGVIFLPDCANNWIRWRHSAAHQKISLLGPGGAHHLLFLNILRIYISVGFPREGDRSVQPFEAAPKSPAAIMTTKMTSRRQWGKKNN
jgi:hypothetical protein